MSEIVRIGDVTGFDDAEVIEGSNYEDDRQNVRCTEMGSADTSSGGGNTVFCHCADMGIALRRRDSRHDNGD